MPSVLTNQVDTFEASVRELPGVSSDDFVSELEDLMAMGLALYERLRDRAEEGLPQTARTSADAYARRFLDAYKRLAVAFEQTEDLIRAAQAEGLSVKRVAEFSDAALQVRSLAQFDYDSLVAAVNGAGPRRTQGEVRDDLRRTMAAKR